LEEVLTGQHYGFDETGTHGRVAKDDRGTSGPLRADPDTAGQCSSPIIFVEDLKERGPAHGFSNGQLGVNTVSHDRVLVFLSISTSSAPRAREVTYHVVIDSGSVKFSHRAFGILMLALPGVVDV
jgi:hypothetical protein